MLHSPVSFSYLTVSSYLYPNCGTAPCPSFFSYLTVSSYHILSLSCLYPVARPRVLLSLFDRIFLSLSYLYPNCCVAPCPFCSYLTVSSYLYPIFIVTVTRPRVPQLLARHLYSQPWLISSTALLLSTHTHTHAHTLREGGREGEREREEKRR